MFHFGICSSKTSWDALREMPFSMCYSIGSISKQFTAAAILLLQEQGKLSIRALSSFQ